MPIEPNDMQMLIDRLTLVSALAWGVVAFVRGWVVPASVFRTMTQDRDDWKIRHDRIAAIAELALRAKVGGGA